MATDGSSMLGLLHFPSFPAMEHRKYDAGAAIGQRLANAYHDILIKGREMQRIQREMTAISNDQDFAEWQEGHAH